VNQFQLTLWTFYLIGFLLIYEVLTDILRLAFR